MKCKNEKKNVFWNKRTPLGKSQVFVSWGMLNYFSPCESKSSCKLTITCAFAWCTIDVQHISRRHKKQASSTIEFRYGANIKKTQYIA